MVENISVAQARVLLTSLYEHVNEISLSIAKVERQLQHSTRVYSLRHHRLRIQGMRKDLHEAHRLIDGLHRRYPGAREPRPHLRETLSP